MQKPKPRPLTRWTPIRILKKGVRGTFWGCGGIMRILGSPVRFKSERAHVSTNLCFYKEGPCTYPSHYLLNYNFLEA